MVESNSTKVKTWREDLTGKRSGKLLVLRLSEKKDIRRWHCRCDCGNTVEARTSDLKSGMVKSCGCLPDGPKPRIDLRNIGSLEELRGKVKVTESGCWLWSEVDRRPRTTIDGEYVTLYRAIWEKFRGPIPDGLNVCHNCPGGDDRRCINPEHLWLGTTAENNADMAKKDRSCFGEKHGQVKINAETAVNIFLRYHKDGERQADIAASLGIHRMIVRFVVYRKTWRRATEEVARHLGILKEGEDICSSG